MVNVRLSFMLLVFTDPERRHSHLVHFYRSSRLLGDAV